ncbi:MAG: hypothetical protein SGI90_06740 [Candidatus Eisenbacteria bacterium]|nr:hypothetical protein [Candidatus Eisenbacteria bacterium]
MTFPNIHIPLVRAIRIVGAGALVIGLDIVTAHAAGTLSGTAIDNHATINYKVGGLDQTPVDSDTASFVVDSKIDLAVSTSDGAAVPVTPGSSDQVLTFQVTNEGNTTRDFSLTAPNSATPAFAEPSEDFDAGNIRIFVDANGNGTYDSGVDLATYIDELEPDSSVTVFVVSNIPLSVGNGDVASTDLIAQAAIGGTPLSQGVDVLSDDSGSADNPATVQTVFADGAGSADPANDGRHSSKDAYKGRSADLNVSKTADVSFDPVNGGTNPKAIPGATVDYGIQVDNNGTVSATNVVVVDAVPGSTSFLVGSTASTPGGTTIEYSDDGGATWSYSPVAGVDGSDPSVTHLRVTFASIANGAGGQVDFQVLIL